MTTSVLEDWLQRAVGTVLASLPPEGDLLPEEVAAACDDVHRMFTRRGDIIDLMALRREVEHRVTVWQAPSTGLDDPTPRI